LEATFQGGVLGYFHAVSCHPYRAGYDFPETVLYDYNRLTNLIKQYNPSKPQLIVSSEWGYTTCEGCTVGNQVHTITQAKYVARQWLIHTYANVPVSIWYDWKDDGTDASNGEFRFGTVQNQYQNQSQPYVPKPSYYAAVAIQTYLSPTSNVYRSRINATVNGQVDDNGYVLSFSKTGGTTVTAYAVWKTDATVTCPNVQADNRIDCGFFGITQGECTNRGCCYQVSAGPYCYFQETSASLSFSASASGSTCFKVVDYTGKTINNSLCPQNNQFTLTASDGPLYLVN